MVALVAYAVTLSAGFVWDDHSAVLANEGILSLTRIPALFVSHAFAGASNLVGERVVEYYRPVWMLSLALDHAVWGLKPFGYHLTNVFLHAACSVAVVIVLRRLVSNTTAALLGGLLFAIHPVHVEAVAWVSARSDLLAGLFLVLSFLADLESRRSNHAWREMAIGALLFSLALLSKEIAITLPLLVLLAEMARGSGSALERSRAPIVMALVAIAYGLLRHRMVHALLDPHPLASRLLTAPRLVAEYLGLLLVPLDLKTFHSIRVVEHPASIAFGLPLACVAIAVGAIVGAWRRLPILAFGLAWTLVALIPVTGIPGTLKPALLAERYLYVASVGFCCSFAALIEWAMRIPRFRGIVTVGALVLIAGFAAMCHARSRAWHDDETLASRMVRDAPSEETGHENLGMALQDRGDREGAIPELEIAARLEPSDHLAHRNLGIAYAQAGRAADAGRELSEALRRKPDYAEAYYDLGWLASRSGDWEAARRAFAADVALRPRQAPDRVVLGVAYMNLDRFDEAEQELRTALSLDPRSADGHRQLGSLYRRRGRLAEAERELGLAISISPSPEVQDELGLLMLERDRDAEAASRFRAAVDLEPSWGMAHVHLGVALARLDRGDDARAELAIARRLASGDSTLARAVENATRLVGAPRGQGIEHRSGSRD